MRFSILLDVLNAGFMKNSLVFFLLVVFPVMLFGQKSNGFVVAEDSLIHLSYKILNERDEFVRFEAAKFFDEMLFSTLEKPGSFDYSFDSLTSVSIQIPDDRSFRIFTWGIPKQDGTYDYGGVLQVNTGKTSGKIYHLNDLSAELQNPEGLVLSPKNWYGALYYKLLTSTYKDNTIYTLLGWDACFVQSRRKVIEILSFNKAGEPFFGAAAFTRFPRKVKRVIFEHSSRVSMTLNYSEQAIKVKSGKKASKPQYKAVHKEMIVFDRLIPQDPQLEGVFQFYVPETNVYDGFLFEKGKWQFVKDVDARNPEREGKALPKSKKESGLLPPPGPKK